MLQYSCYSCVVLSKIKFILDWLGMLLEPTPRSIRLAAATVPPCAWLPSAIGAPMLVWEWPEMLLSP